MSFDPLIAVIALYVGKRMHYAQHVANRPRNLHEMGGIVSAAFAFVLDEGLSQVLRAELLATLIALVD